ncbi:MAG: hypothetical protein AAGB00_01700 [Planctomycetota bacterium]
MTLHQHRSAKRRSAREKAVERLRKLRRRRRARGERRGVLLLVVLTMLVLFLLVGTTFVIIAASARDNQRIREQANETSPQPGDRLQQALLQVLRDTNNPYSSIRYHSLLRDTYGTDGFVGHAYAGVARNVNDASAGFDGPNSLGFADYVSRYADATALTGVDYGPTRGQLIDIFVEDDIVSSRVGALQTLISSGAVGLSAEYVVDLELNEQGLTTNHRLSRISGYYNGCYLTVLEGPAKGRTTQVVQYDYFVDTSPGGSVVAPNPLATGYARFRVLAFARSDGTPLRLGLDVIAGATNDLIRAEDANGNGAIDNQDNFHGVRFMVNGRAQNGTGVGFNPLAEVGGPRLSAVEALTYNGQVIGVEAALAPHARHFQPLLAARFDATLGTSYPASASPPIVDPFYGNQAAAYTPLGQQYAGYAGAGGSDESYDAADFQNVFLALQSLHPRPAGRLISSTRGPAELLDPSTLSIINNDTGVRLQLDDVPIPSFHRSALINYWFHKLYRAPWLVAAVPDATDRVRAILAPLDQLGSQPAVAEQIIAIKRKISLRPLTEDHPNFSGSNPESVYANRLNPNDGSVTRMALDANGDTDNTPENVAGRLDDQIVFPYWEATGPWDVDNDNDGVPDSIWVDLGDPVQKTSDGRLYKPLYAILIEDLDGRPNLNAHGSKEQLALTDLDPSTNDPTTATPPAANFNLASGASSLLGLSGSQLITSNQLASGGGWGPGDISLRPVLSPELATTGSARFGDSRYDDAVRVLVGRQVPGGATGPLASIGAETDYGRYGANGLTTASGVLPPPGAGANFVDGAAESLQTQDALASLELSDYPAFDRQRGELAITNINTLDAALVLNTTPAERRESILALGGGVPNGYAYSPDLQARYAAPGLSYGGAAYAEAATDGGAAPLVSDSPYEVRLLENDRRGVPQLFSLTGNDDAPFSAAELERVLRANDADAGRLPGRLWDIVDAFDADKLAVQLYAADPLNAGGFVPSIPQRYVAQREAAERRRSVTTDSVEIPTPSDNWNARLVYGADGRPGVAAVNDGDASGLPAATDEPFELNAPGSDDYAAVMGAAPPAGARLLDYLRYRVVLELKRQGVIPAGLLIDADPATLSEPARDAVNEAEQRVRAVIYGDNGALATATRQAGGLNVYATYGGLLAPEVLAGSKMDVNRPLGDGKDNNGNGIVDEPIEAGEPWIDADGDGVWDGGSSEPYLDLDGDGRFYADADGDGAADGDTGVDADDDWFDFDGDGIEEPIVDSLYARQLGFPVAFSHTGGADANGRGTLLGGGGVLRDDGPMARQLYARHLYCLMLLVMDDAYLAPYDDRDPQIMHYLDPDSVERELRPGGGTRIKSRSVANQIKQDLMDNRGLADADASAEARRIAQRKLTCRQIAQWAINCVDMRDPDSIRTPFEYDENPWDGWNVVDSNANGSAADDRVYPLDGDLTTDENRQYTRTVTASTGWSAPERVDVDGSNLADSDTVAGYDQTRGVVWGVESPDLLLTEGFAGHDRRVSDEAIGGLLPGGVESAVDDDLDQFYRPKGFTYIEVYNPNDPNRPRPAESHRDPGGQYRFAEMDRDAEGDGPPADANNDGLADGGDDNGSDVKVEGVLLDRLSDAAAPVRDFMGLYKLANGRRSQSPNGAIVAPSPVWRMICVEQHPQLRNEDPFDDEVPSTQGGVSDYLELVNSNEAPSAYRDIAEETLDATQSVLDVLSPGGAAASISATSLLPALRASLVDQRQAVPNPARMPDPDFPSFDRVAVPTVEQTSINVGEESRRRFFMKKPLEYIEREWYFTRERRVIETGNPPYFNPYAIGLCIPDRPLQVEVTPTIDWPEAGDEETQLWPEGVVREPRVTGVFRTGGDLLIYPRKFPPLERVPTAEGGDGATEFRSIPIAPVLPGHYGVIGSAGYQYDNRRQDGTYITRIGRLVDEQPGDAAGGAALDGCRRIELVPNRNPYLHQVVVGRNFGDEYRLMAPAGGNYLVNATDPARMPRNASDLTNTISGVQTMKEFNESPDLPAFYTDPTKTGGYQAFELDPDDTDDMRLYAIRPAVAVPVEGMNISEPLDGYLLRRAESDGTQVTVEDEEPIEQGFAVRWLPEEYSGEGTYGKVGDGLEEGSSTQPGYDLPFDAAPELILNHTTPNYRSVHLQRLANPRYAWNPEPIQVNGVVHPQHDPARPVNPYLTIDSMSLDVTAFNSINEDEERIDPTLTELPDAVNTSRTRRLLEEVFDADVSRVGNRTLDPVELHKQQHYRPLVDVQRDENDSKNVLMLLSSQYRGFHEQTLSYKDDPNDTEVQRTLQPGRLIYQRERANQLVDILDQRIDRASQAEATGGHPDLGGGVTRIDTTALKRSFNAINDLTFDYPFQHSLGYDNSAVIRKVELNPAYDDGAGGVRDRPAAGSTRDDRPFYRTNVQLVGSFSAAFGTGSASGNAFEADENNMCYRVDVNGDGLRGDLVGVPLVNDDPSNVFDADDPRTPQDENGQPDYRDDVTYPWLTWNDRPFVSAGELLLAPSASSSRLTLDYSVDNPFQFDPPSRYDGFAEIDTDAETTNAKRLGAARTPFGHLLPVFQASSEPAVTLQSGTDLIPVGAGNFHRIMDFLHTPSRFVGTDLLLDPTLFNADSVAADSFASGGSELTDPRRGFLAPLNRVAKLREPGKMNLNTMVGTGDVGEARDRWSLAYDALMHRYEDGNLIAYNDIADPADDVLITAGHLGPAWRDVALSRRGYTAGVLGYSEAALNPDFPTRFANPFRSASAGDLVPITQLEQYGSDASVLRAHPYSPGADGCWGSENADSGVVDKSGDGLVDADLLDDNTAEAGAPGSDDVLLARTDGALPDSQKLAFADNASLPVEPLFSEGATEAALDGGRNPGVAYNPLTRLSNLTTTRSGVFAVWITVGFFEVSPAPAFVDGDLNGVDDNRFYSRETYNRVYPDGYQLGRELGADTGNTNRYRGFWMIDRTRPVAFRPGENVNAERAILLQRRIE